MGRFAACAETRDSAAAKASSVGPVTARPLRVTPRAVRLMRTVVVVPLPAARDICCRLPPLIRCVVPAPA
ncbi:hypothetical protein HMPREF1549_01207 [Actinomyces johnsonii F0510]|uniref:Uncharacterized protein n=1 Tax=Actinomyces johnsonii F0510 TaxID=1227262 RepID=U1RLE5_9ACTO|nr:hypothetical protein HMPREF1549_01207 [Actinomyces johnsonii F0510]